MAVVESCVTISKYSAYSWDDDIMVLLSCMQPESITASVRYRIMFIFLIFVLAVQR